MKKKVHIHLRLNLLKTFVNTRLKTNVILKTQSRFLFIDHEAEILGGMETIQDEIFF